MRHHVSRFFTSVVMGQVMARKSTPFVKKEVITEIHMLQGQGLDMKDILNRLRPQTVPAGYCYHPWKPGID